MQHNNTAEHLNKIAAIKPLIEAKDAAALRRLGYGDHGFFSQPSTDADIIKGAKADLDSLEKCASGCTE